MCLPCTGAEMGLFLVLFGVVLYLPCPEPVTHSPSYMQQL